jgi:hypothetical protein
MRRLIGQTFGALLLAGCALGAPSAQPGQSQDEVLARLGAPTGRYAMPEGAQRLEYARGPSGRVTWMIDVDAAGRVTQVAQVLQERYFAQVRDGMPQDALLRLLGRPAQRAGEWQHRETWSWRFETHECLWFRVTLSADRKVVHGGAMMPDPQCDAGADPTP